VSASVLCAILAAGAGRRMGGRPKGSLRLPDGWSFAGAIARTCREAGVARVALVLAPGADPPADAVAAGVEILCNPEPDATGMLGSIHAALRSPLADGADALLVWPVDCPRVPPDVVRAVVDAFARTEAPIVCPRHTARRGHPALFAARLFPELLAAPMDRGARAVTRAHAADRLEVEVDAPEVLDDLDTPEDLAAL
jgi:CTP:molybdopterin cytidylyltransferase MocA